MSDLSNFWGDWQHSSNDMRPKRRRVEIGDLKFWTLVNYFYGQGYGANWVFPIDPTQFSKTKAERLGFKLPPHAPELSPSDSL